jgi:zinc protease
MTLEQILATRPTPGQPRTYSFPRFASAVLPSGLEIRTIQVPGRPLVSASLVLRAGSSDEPHEIAGATVLAARSMSEGTERYPGVELIEASERLGATLHVEATWDATFAAVDVAASRLGAALELLAELVQRPMFPEEDVARLRDERINDLLQVRADPRRRAERVFAETIYSPASPYSRPAGGNEATVPGLTRDALVRVHGALLRPERAALVVAGDLTGLDVAVMAQRAFEGLRPAGAAGAGAVAPDAAGAVTEPIVRFFHRPGSVQTELRIGHVGLARRTPDFHAVGVMSTILGGLFNSRLQMNLREDKGYTYGVGAGFDMRRAAGPFAVRTAVHTAVTVPAIRESLAELARMRETAVTPAELATARDYLVGVFPLRFETPGAVVGAVSGLFVQGLPDDELARYRAAVEAVTAEDVRRAAYEHIHPDRLAIVAVGDADAVGKDLEAAGFGRLEVIADDAGPGGDPEALDEADEGDEDGDGGVNGEPGAAGFVARRRLEVRP